VILGYALPGRPLPILAQFSAASLAAVCAALLIAVLAPKAPLASLTAPLLAASLVLLGPFFFSVSLINLHALGTPLCFSSLS